MKYALCFNEQLSALTDGGLADNLITVGECDLTWNKLDTPGNYSRDLLIGCDAQIHRLEVNDKLDEITQDLSVKVVGLLTEDEMIRGKDFEAKVYVFVELEENCPLSLLEQCAPDSRIMMVDPPNTGFRYVPGEIIRMKSYAKNDHDLEGVEARIMFIQTQMTVEGW